MESLLRFVPFSFPLLLMLMTSGCDAQTSGSCGPTSFTSATGYITSPNYPLNYNSSTICNYVVTAPSLSAIDFTIEILGLEMCCDYIEFVCQSNSIRRPIRYTGSGNRTYELSFRPCTRVLARFYSDGSVVGQGFIANYTVDPIRCKGDCTPIAIGAGYNCTCDDNQTDPYIAPPYDQCPDGCYLSSTLSNGYCMCSYQQTNTFTTPLPTTDSATFQCPYGCYFGRDSYGFQVCYCQGTTTSAPCPTGCYNVTYSWGYSYCDCSSPTSSPTTPTWTYAPDSGCGSSLNASRGEVTSPSYPSYAFGYNQCLQTVTVESATSINITFTDLNFYYSYSDCQYDWVQITGCDGSVRRICSSTVVGSSINFLCNVNFSVLILFNPYYYSYVYRYRGFKLTYEANFESKCNSMEDGGLVYLGSGGRIASPLYPLSYPISNDCYYVLQTSGSNVGILVSFISLRMPYTPGCTVDYIKLGCAGAASAITSVCGDSIPKPITFDCTTVEIKFHSESLDGIAPKLFKIVYYGIGVSKHSGSSDGQE